MFFTLKSTWLEMKILPPISFVKYLKYYKYCKKCYKTPFNYNLVVTWLHSFLGVWLTNRNIVNQDATMVFFSTSMSMFLVFADTRNISGNHLSHSWCTHVNTSGIMHVIALQMRSFKWSSCCRHQNESLSLVEDILKRYI